MAQVLPRNGSSHESALMCISLIQQQWNYLFHQVLDQLESYILYKDKKDLWQCFHSVHEAWFLCMDFWIWVLDTFKWKDLTLKWNFDLFNYWIGFERHFPFWAQMKIIITASCDDFCMKFLSRNQVYEF